MGKLTLTGMGLCFASSIFAGSPVFTFTPLTSTHIQVRGTDTATVQYRVTNQSRKSHTLVMQAISGINQLSGVGYCTRSFSLNYQQSCLLTLQINGSQLSGNISHGPVVCQQKPNGQPDPLLCYQPSAADILHVSLAPALAFYAGTQNGNVYYSTNNGSSWAPTTMPSAGSPINSVFASTQTLYAGAANGLIFYSYNQGSNWFTTATSPDGSAVNIVFAFGNTLYAGTDNGFVYFSNNNGNSWRNTTAPDGSAVNAIFVTNSALYAGTANGFVYHSTNQGGSWTTINGQPDGSAIRSIFVTPSKIRVNTANEFVYESTAINGGGTWHTVAQTVYSFFVNTNSDTLYAGTQSGFVYSLTTGTALGFVGYSPINSLYVLG